MKCRTTPLKDLLKASLMEKIKRGSDGRCGEQIGPPYLKRADKEQASEGTLKASGGAY